MTSVIILGLDRSGEVCVLTQEGNCRTTLIAKHKMLECALIFILDRGCNSGGDAK